MVSAIMAGLGAATSLASGIYGAIKSAQEGRKAQQLIDTQREENKRWYELKRAEDYTQRPDAQAIIKKQRDLLNEQYKASAARNVVAGGSDESLALQQKEANESLDNTMTNIAAQAQAGKDAAEEQYLTRDAQLTQQQIATAQNQSAQTAQAAGQGVNAGLGMLGTGIQGISGKKSK